jgi:uncharacterized protein
MPDSPFAISVPDSIFLTAEWRSLLMLNYEVDPALLSSFLPAGTQLDFWNGRAFISLVGFLFLKTKVLGVPIPFHRNFEEVNLRFYVKRTVENEIRRGVVFVKEIVPRWAIAFVARTLYGENYLSLPMAHRIEPGEDAGLNAEYAWKNGAMRNSMIARASGDPVLPQNGSEAQFITEHYWGYAAQKDGSCVEYQVAHPSWRVWNAKDCSLTGEMTQLYGEKLGMALKSEPASAFLAEGSEVVVYRGKKISPCVTAQKL